MSQQLTAPTASTVSNAFDVDTMLVTSSGENSIVSMPAEPEESVVQTTAEPSRINRLVYDRNMADGVVSVVRSDDPARQPVDRHWFAAACRACLEDCHAVVELSGRLSNSDGEESSDYAILNELASRAVTLIAASLSQISGRTGLAAPTWKAATEVVHELSEEADNFPFDSWASQCAEGCRQLEISLRQAAVAGIE